MNDSNIENLRSLFDNFVRAAESVVVEYEKLGTLRKMVEDGVSSIKKRESLLESRETNLMREKHEIERISEESKDRMAQVVKKSQDLEEIQARLKKARENIGEQMNSINAKMKELADLENRMEEIKKVEQAVLQKEEDLKTREAALEKEKQVARVRKLALDSLQQKIESQQKRLNKYLDLYQSTDVV